MQHKSEVHKDFRVIHSQTDKNICKTKGSTSIKVAHTTFSFSMKLQYGTIWKCHYHLFFFFFPYKITASFSKCLHIKYCSMNGSFQTLFSHTLHSCSGNKITDFCVTKSVVLYSKNACIFIYTTSTSKNIYIIIPAL